jgi:hypothetical protein
MRTLALLLVVSNGWFHNGRMSAAGGISGALREATSWANAYSVNFDGSNDFVTLGQPTDIDGASPWPLTISAWYRQADLGEQHYVVSRSRPFAPVITFAMATNTDGTAFTYLGSSGDTTSGGALGSLVWRHLVVTASTSGTTGKLYVDGVQVGSNMTTLGTDDATVDWLIGASRNLADNSDAALFADGNIDEVTFWNVELSAAEVLALYNSGVPANPAAHSRAANLIHYYPMGDGDTYPTLNDLVGTADGTMTNMAGGDIEAVIPELLSPLSCSGTCDLNMSADDWSGSGNWASGAGGFTAAYNGTVTRAVSPTFHSRRYVTGWSSSNYFLLPADTAHDPGNDMTYEFVLDNLPSTGLVTWYGNITNGNDGGQWFFTQSSNRFELGIANLAAGYYLGGLTAAEARVPDKPILITVTIKYSASPALSLFVNGTELTSGVFPDTSTSGTLNTESCAIAIGGRWSCNGNSLGSPDSSIRVMQIVRHREILSGATISARAAQFARLKGY